MSLSSTAQALFDIAKSSLPRFLFQRTDTQELLGGFASLMDRASSQLDAWITNTNLLLSSGVWLDQHARDRGTFRQANESDTALRTRLRLLADAVTVPAVKAVATEQLQAEGITVTGGYPGVVELRKDRAFFLTNTGTGRKDAYLSRGYRMGTQRPMRFIVILPYPTPASTAGAVSEQVRLTRAAGYPHSIETRGVP